MSKARWAGPRCVGRAEEGARPRGAVPYGRYRQRRPTGLRAQSKGCPHRQNSRGGGKGSTGTGKAPLRGTGRAAAPGAGAAARKAKGRWPKGSRTAAFRAPIRGAAVCRLARWCAAVLRAGHAELAQHPCLPEFQPADAGSTHCAGTRSPRRMQAETPWHVPGGFGATTAASFPHDPSRAPSNPAVRGSD